MWDFMNPQKTIKKSSEKFLSGRIRDIKWSFDSERLLVVGEGLKEFGRVVSLELTKIGELLNCSKPLLSGQFSPQRPFKIATGGEDFQVNFYEGPPFKFLKSTKTHTSFINSVRFDKTGEHLISVSSDRKIFLYNAKTAELISEFP